MGHIRHRLAIAALVLGLGSAGLACSAGSGGKRVSLQSGATHPGASAAPGTIAAGTTGATAGPSASAPATTTKTNAGSTATTRPAGPVASTATTAPRITIPPATGPAPAAVGTYNYNLVSGSSILTTGTTSTTLAVAPQTTLVVSGGGGQETWVNASTTTNLVFNSAGVFLVAETVPLANTTCTFSSPVASPPWPLAVGKTFSGQGTCGSGTLDLQGQVQGTASLHLDGASVNTFLVKTTLTLGSTLTVVELDWYAPSLRLPVKTTIGVAGGVTGYSIASTATYLLASARPS